MKSTAPDDKNRTSDLKFFSKTVFFLLKNFRASLERLEECVEPSTNQTITSTVFEIFRRHFDVSLLKAHSPTPPSAPSVSTIHAPKKRSVAKRAFQKLKSLQSARFFQNTLSQKILGKMREGVKKKRETAVPAYISFLKTATDEQLLLAAQSIALEKYDELKMFKERGESFDKKIGKRCALISSVFGTTWAPTMQTLKSKGWPFLLCLHGDIKETGSYGALTTKEIKLGEIEFSSLLSDIIFMTSVSKCPVLINGETYHGACWNAEDAVALYMIQSIVLKTAQEIRKVKSNNLIYLMYDGLKPVIYNCPEVKESLSAFYSDYLSHIDRIIFNSNDTSFGDFLENSYRNTTPRIHFMRYSSVEGKCKKRIDFGKKEDEFHMVCITTCLNTAMDGARLTAADLVRSFLNQGIHFHYYACEDQDTIDRFIETIPTQKKRFFHVHSINRNQKELVNELAQYHAGINPSDYLPFGQVHCYLKDRKYQDGMTKYLQSSHSTSSLVYAAAGLPVILPAGAYDSCQFLPVAIPFVFSEHETMKERLVKMNLKKACQKAFEERESVSIEHHIHKLEKFLCDSLH